MLLVAAVNRCSLDNGGCSHLCLPGLDEGYSCACPTGFLLLPDGRACAGSKNDFLIKTSSLFIGTLNLLWSELAETN